MRYSMPRTAQFLNERQECSKAKCGVASCPVVQRSALPAGGDTARLGSGCHQGVTRVSPTPAPPRLSIGPPQGQFAVLSQNSAEWCEVRLG